MMGTVLQHDGNCIVYLLFCKTLLHNIMSYLLKWIPTPVLYYLSDTVVVQVIFSALLSTLNCLSRKVTNLLITTFIFT